MVRNVYSLLLAYVYTRISTLVMMMMIVMVIMILMVMETRMTLILMMRILSMSKMLVLKCILPGVVFRVPVDKIVSVS